MAAAAIAKNENREMVKVKTRPPPLDVSLATAGPDMRTPTPTGFTPRDRTLTDMERKEKKIGHRRVNIDEDGIVQITYKKKPTSELMAAIQLGIGQNIGGISSKPQRDLLMQDFTVTEPVNFPREGSTLTPAHHSSDFRFKTYAPVAFRYFRELFGIQPDDFLLCMCNEPLEELSNPGASGSIFYITQDDEFIIKTVQHKEAEFLQKLLPGYYMNLNQNPRTLLPKFYGLYCYQCGGKNIRFITMNNLLPSSIKMHEKYDLKGSTYKRKASKSERKKASPTLKDLDFIDNNSDGIFLEQETYTALMKTIQRDCRVLQSFKIMDYSLLIGIHNLDIAKTEKEIEENGEGSSSTPRTATPQGGTMTEPLTPGRVNLARAKSMKQRLAAFSTALESIQAETEPINIEDEDVPPGGIPARNSKGERLLLYLGLIDILQSYRFKKKLEHGLKSMITDGETVSVTRPAFYSDRFQKFFAEKVFKKIPSPMKHSPSKKKAYGRQRSFNEADQVRQGVSHSTKPDLVANMSTTPPPTFAESQAAAKSSSADEKKNKQQRKQSNNSIEAHEMVPKVIVQGETKVRYKESTEFKFSTVVKESSEKNHVEISTPNDMVDQLSLKSDKDKSPTMESTPSHSVFTEGTPSFTMSSPSHASDIASADEHDGNGDCPDQEDIKNVLEKENSNNQSTDASGHDILSTLKNLIENVPENKDVSQTNISEKQLKSQNEGNEISLDDVNVTLKEKESGDRNSESHEDLPVTS